MQNSSLSLKSIATLIMGQSPKGETYNNEKIGLPLLNGASDYKGLTFMPKVYTSDPIKIVKQGDIIFGVRATIGNVSICDRDYCIGRGIAGVRVNQKYVDKKFVIIFIKKALEEMLLKASGSTIKGLKKIDIENIKIPLQPLQTQKKIVEVLDKAQELIDLRKKQIELLDDLIQSVFYDMFGDPVTNQKGWDRINLGEIIVSVTNGISRRRKAQENIGDVVLRLRDIKENNIDYSELNRIYLTEKEKEKYSVNINDLLFIRVNGNPEYVGRCSIYQGFKESVYFNDHIMRVSFSNCIHPLFISLYLNGKIGKRELKKYIKTSAGQHTIAQSGLEKVRTILPPLELQNQFAQKVQKIEEQKERMKKSLVGMENNFKSLMQKAFRGELFN